MNEANAISYSKSQNHHLEDHVDDRFLSKEVICNLSLLGDCRMTFTRVKDSTKGLDKGKKGDEVKVLLKRRTLQVLTGEARYNYTHGIRNEDILGDERISITMRESPLTDNKN